MTNSLFNMMGLEDQPLPAKALPPTPDEPDPDRDAWSLGVEILISQGDMRPKAARTFFGRLLSGYRLKARTLMPALLTALESGTLDPQAYLSKAAKGAGEQQGDPALKAAWT